MFHDGSQAGPWAETQAGVIRDPEAQAWDDKPRDL